MPKSKHILVELVYEKTCPNIKAARSQLVNAFATVGLQPNWQEWEVSDSAAPQHIHGYGSPTILVNKQDVSGEMKQGDDYCCRVYSHEADVSKGVPAVSDIINYLKQAKNVLAETEQKPASRLGLGSTTLPAIGVAFLPKLACPACWPAYAGLLSSFGVGFVDYTPYLFPLTIIFLLIALAALAYKATNRRGYKPLAVGLLASTVLLVGKFHFESEITMYTGLILLVGASLWNSWPKTRKNNASCPACII